MKSKTWARLTINTVGVGVGVGFGVIVGVDIIVDFGVNGGDCFSIGFEFTPHPMRASKSNNTSNKKPALK
jgi:hypothetical protein